MQKKKKYTLFEFNGKVVKGYDSFNHLTSLWLDRYWRKKTAQMVIEDMGMRKGAVLDLAAGTGDMAFALKAVHATVPVIGTDPSFEMLQIGQQKQGDKPAHAVQFIRAVSRLPIADDRMDAVTCAFGMRNFAHLQEDVRELARLLKKGGRVYILDFFKPTNFFATVFLKIYNYTIFPLIGFCLTGQTKSYRYLFRSIFVFRTPQEMMEILSRAGYRPVRIKSLFFGLVHVVVAEKE